MITSATVSTAIVRTTRAGVALLAAVSGVTALAIDVAQTAGLTLLGFARGEDICIYSHAERLVIEQSP